MTIDDFVSLADSSIGLVRACCIEDHELFAIVRLMFVLYTYPYISLERAPKGNPTGIRISIIKMFTIHGKPSLVQAVQAGAPSVIIKRNMVGDWDRSRGARRQLVSMHCMVLGR